MPRITDHWDPKFVGMPDEHDRGVMNVWEPVSRRLRASGDAEAADLIEAMADRLELPKETVPRPGRAFVVFEPRPWRDAIDRLQRSEAAYHKIISDLQSEAERRIPWYRKAFLFLVMSSWALSGRKGPIG